jgi:hypothetical protein
MQKKLKQSENYVRLKINLDRVKIDLSGHDARKCLREVNKILDRVIKAQDTDETDFRIEHMFGADLELNGSMTKLLNNFAQIYQDYRTNRVAIENKKIVELERGSVENKLDIGDIKKGVKKLLFPIQHEHVKHAIIHVRGSIAQDEAKKVTDLIENELPNVDVHTLYTTGDVQSHTVIEGVFFGEFQQEFDTE